MFRISNRFSTVLLLLLPIAKVCANVATKRRVFAQRNSQPIPVPVLSGICTEDFCNLNSHIMNFVVRGEDTRDIPRNDHLGKFCMSQNVLQHVKLLHLGWARIPAGFKTLAICATAATLTHGSESTAWPGHCCVMESAVSQQAGSFLAT